MSAAATMSTSNTAASDGALFGASDSAALQEQQAPPAEETVAEVEEGNEGGEEEGTEAEGALKREASMDKNEESDEDEAGERIKKHVLNKKERKKTLKEQKVKQAQKELAAKKKLEAKKNARMGEGEEEAEVKPAKKKGLFAKLLQKEVDLHSHVTTSIETLVEEYECDMTHPLPHYFINSGHNSYLIGNQITGRVTPKIVATALSAGCRVIELDCWDSKKGPMVLHGGTLTLGVELKKFLSVIVEHAFTASQYPVIVTLENHMNAENQDKTADMIEEIFGDTLFKPDEGFLEKAEMPSPEALKGKILIRDKHMKDFPKKKPSLKLSSLVSIRNLKHKMAISSSTPASSSRNESNIKGMWEEPEATVKHTQKHLIRTYPAGFRVDSSNYDPATVWAMGGQIAALNWQTNADALWVNKAFFKLNKGANYVLKPPTLLQEGKYVNANDISIGQTLKVTVNSIRNVAARKNFMKRKMPLWREDVYVRLELHGAPRDHRIERTSFHRIQNTFTFDESFYFPLACPDTAVLLMSVYDFDYGSQDDYIAHNGVPICAVKTGSYVVPMLSKKHKPASEGLPKQFEVVVTFDWVDGECFDSESTLKHQLEMVHEELRLIKAGNDGEKVADLSDVEALPDLSTMSHAELMAENMALREELKQARS